MAPTKTQRKKMRSVQTSDDEEYRRKRDRNNLAVKRSRVKSRLKTQETLERVQQLKKENDQLEEKIKLLSKELGFLKDLFLAHTGTAMTPVLLQGLDLENLLLDEGECSTSHSK